MFEEDLEELENDFEEEDMSESLGDDLGDDFSQRRSLKLKDNIPSAEEETGY